MTIWEEHTSDALSLLIQRVLLTVAPEVIYILRVPTRSYTVIRFRHKIFNIDKGTMSAPKLKVLRAGAGVAGPCLAYWLAKTYLDISVTIIEPSPSSRVTGQSIDIRGLAIEIIKRTSADWRFSSKGRERWDVSQT